MQCRGINLAGAKVHLRGQQWTASVCAAHGDCLVKYLIRIAMMGISLATITPVARGATLDGAGAMHSAAAETR